MITLETNCFEYQFKDNAWHYRLKGKKDWLEVMSLVNQELLTLAHKQQQQAKVQALALVALRVAAEEALSHLQREGSYTGAEESVMRMLQAALQQTEGAER